MARPLRTRREFLRSLLAGPVGLPGLHSLLVAGCQQGSEEPPDSVSSSLPVSLVPDRSALAPVDPVAVEACRSYDPREIHSSLERAFSRLGGLDGLVAGKTVTVKLNVTGTSNRPMAGLPPARTYQSHPVMVEALCDLLSRAGARRIVLAESYGEARAPEEILAELGWDIQGIRSAGRQRVLFEDTRNLGDFPDYAVLEVPYGGYVFPRYHLNRRYVETDVLVSLAKLKNHVRAGVTCAAKNLFGLTPSALYGNDAPNEASVATRSAILHLGIRTVPSGVTAERYPTPLEESEPGSGDVSRIRVPRVTADLASLRPVDLSIVDGVESVSGGEGPWNADVRHNPTRPGAIVVGTNPVTTDAVCTAIMGYDPNSATGVHPFPGENHLHLLARAGTGSNDLSRIEVRGSALSDVLYPYSPDLEEGRWTERFLRGEA